MTVSNSFFYAYYCAGIAGLNNDSIERCTNRAYISGIYAGGIQGCSIGFDNTENPIVSKCVNNGVVFGYNYELELLAGKVGGISGTVYDDDNLGTTENCINFGNVYGRNVGGIMGEVTAANYQIKNCYNVGACTTYWYYKNLYPEQSSEWETVGAIVGDYRNLGDIQNCYYESTDANHDGIVDETDEIDNTFARTKAQFNFGAVCYELNSGASLTEADEPIFYQNLTTKSGTTIDAYPVLDPQHEKVYLVTIQYGTGFETAGLEPAKFYVNAHDTVDLPTFPDKD